MAVGHPNVLVFTNEPPDIVDNFQFISLDINGRPNRLVTHIYRPKRAKLNNSLLYKGVKIYESLPEYIRFQPVKIFNKHIYEYIMHNLSWENIN